ncbi:MAG TPA: hypothetical protein VLT16_11490 [Candidatus Limnocylindrales bacterium]|nr:hypothetical protein [Candidatus Limnocylindrales bacterium]
MRFLNRQGENHARPTPAHIIGNGKIVPAASSRFHHLAKMKGIDRKA